jgi:hypothetical protein
LASVSIGAHFVEHGGHSFPRSYERRVKFLFIRSFIEEFKRHVTESSGKRQLSPKRPLLDNLEGDGLLGLMTDEKGL